MESCGGAHWLARKCQAVSHTTKLIPPQYVKPYVKTNKNDFIDADAIAEAASRPSMRFVSVKTEESQVISVIQRVRSSYLKDRTACMFRIGSILLEFGMSFPRSHSKMKSLFQWLAEYGEPIPPMLFRELTDLRQSRRLIGLRPQRAKISARGALHLKLQLISMVIIFFLISNILNNHLFI